MVKDLEKHPFLDGIKEENKQDAINAYKKEGQQAIQKEIVHKMIQLNPNEVEKRDNSVEKFRTNPLTKPKSKELKRIPEKEKQQAIEQAILHLYMEQGCDWV